PVCEARSIVIPDRAPALPDPFAILELSEEDRREQVGRQEARAKIHPGVLVHEAAEEVTPVRPLLSDDLGAIDKLRVVDDDGAALPAGEVLGLMEALRRHDPEGAEGLTPIRTEQPVRIVFYDVDTMSAGYVEDGSHLAPDTGVMRQDDRAGSGRDQCFELAFIKVERVAPNVDEYRRSTAKHEGVDGRRKRERWNDDLIARTDVGQER